MIKKAQHIVPIPRLRELIDALFSARARPSGTSFQDKAKVAAKNYEEFCAPRLGELELISCKTAVKASGEGDYNNGKDASTENL